MAEGGVSPEIETTNSGKTEQQASNQPEKSPEQGRAREIVGKAKRGVRRLAGGIINRKLYRDEQSAEARKLAKLSHIRASLARAAEAQAQQSQDQKLPEPPQPPEAQRQTQEASSTQPNQQPQELQSGQQQPEEPITPEPQPTQNAQPAVESNEPSGLDLLRQIGILQEDGTTNPELEQEATHGAAGSDIAQSRIETQTPQPSEKLQSEPSKATGSQTEIEEDIDNDRPRTREELEARAGLSDFSPEKAFGETGLTAPELKAINPQIEAEFNNLKVGDTIRQGDKEYVVLDKFDWGGRKAIEILDPEGNKIKFNLGGTGVEDALGAPPPGVTMEEAVRDRLRADLGRDPTDVEVNAQILADTQEAVRALEAATRTRERMAGFNPNILELDNRPTEDDTYKYKGADNLFYSMPVEVAWMQHPNYGPVEIVVPFQAKDKWNIVNKALMALEASASQSAQGAAAEQFQRAQTLIQALMGDKYKREHLPDRVADGRIDANEDIGYKLHMEFTSRQTLHQIMRAIEKAGTLEDTTKYIKDNFDGDILNALFHNLEGVHTHSEVLRAMDYYDKHAVEFMSARGKVITPDGRVSDSLDEFRRKARIAAGGGGNNVNQEEFTWAQTIAERMMYVTLRLHRRDRDGKGKNTGGLYFLDKIANLDRWVVNNEEGQELFPELAYASRKHESDVKKGVHSHLDYSAFKEIDLGVRDYWTKRFTSDLYKRLKEDNATKPTNERLSLKAIADQVTKMTGVPSWLDKDDYSFEPKDQHALTVDFGTLAKYVNDIDFNTLGAGGDHATSPFVDFAVYDIEGPDKVRSALVNSENGFLKNPTKQGLFALKQLLPYMGEDQRVLLTTLIENWFTFATSHEYQERTGKPHMHYEELMDALNEAVGWKDKNGMPIITKDVREKIIKEKINELYSPEYRIRKSPGGQFTIGFILGFLKGFFEEFSKQALNFRLGGGGGGHGGGGHGGH